MCYYRMILKSDHYCNCYWDIFEGNVGGDCLEGPPNPPTQFMCPKSPYSVRMEPLYIIPIHLVVFISMLVFIVIEINNLY